MKKFLKAKERETLRAAHRTERDGKKKDRIKVILLADAGKSVANIAEYLLIDEQTVRRQLAAYSEDKDLDSHSGGSSAMLNEEQAAELKDALAEGLVPNALVAIGTAKQMFGVEFSLSGMTAWLKNHDFSWKKCDGRPAKADEEKQAEFVEAYRALKDGLPADEALLFVDACHPTRTTKLGYAWSIKGVSKEIPTAGTRDRINIVGSIDPERMKVVATFPDTVNTETIAEHFAQLRRAYPQSRYSSIHLVLDNGSYFKAIATKDKAASLGIVLHFLPPYSPNLNVAERLWRYMNEETRNNVYFPDKATFVDAIVGFFRRGRGKLPESQRARFVDNFQQFRSTA